MMTQCRSKLIFPKINKINDDETHYRASKNCLPGKMLLYPLLDSLKLNRSYFRTPTDTDMTLIMWHWFDTNLTLVWHLFDRFYGDIRWFHTELTHNWQWWDESEECFAQEVTGFSRSIPIIVAAMKKTKVANIFRRQRWNRWKCKKVSQKIVSKSVPKSIFFKNWSRWSD